MMNRILYLLTALLLSLSGLMTSCRDRSEADILRTELSLEHARYTLGNKIDDSVQIAIVTEGRALSDVRIPYRLSSSTGAELGVDFALSDSAFTLHKGDSVAYLTVTRKSVSSAKAFLLTLKPVEGVKLGALNYIQVDLMGGNVYTFVDASDELALSKEYSLRLQTAQGAKFSYSSLTRLKLVVDPSSTAVEGEHFEFSGRSSATFRSGKDVGTFTLTMLKVEKGKDHIVLRLADEEGFIAGTNPSIDIRIVGPSDFAGTWAFKSVANKSWFANSWGMDTDKIMEGVATDKITLVGTPTGGYTFTPQLTSKLKNYFSHTCRANFVGERINYLQEAGGNPPPKLSLAEYMLEQVNVACSPSVTKIRQAPIGLRFVRDDNKTKMLEISIYDYEPVESSWNDMLEMMKWSYSEAPYMLDAPIRIYLTQVK